MLHTFCKSGYIIFIAILLAISGSFAQTAELDSLYRKVNSSGGKEKIDALNALAFRQILVDFKLADQAIEEALKLSSKTKYTKGLAEANVYKGICELYRGNKTNALKLLHTGILYAKDAKLSGLEGYALTQLGNLYRNSGVYDSAIYWYDQSYEILKDSLNPWELSVVYRNRARLLSATLQPLPEFKYLMKSYSIRKKLHDKILLADILLLLAQWHIHQGEFNNAKNFLEQALTIKDVPPEIQKDISYQRAIVLFNEAQYLEGIRLLNDVNSFYLSQDNLVSYVKTTIDIADLLEELGSNDLSLKKCYEALSICEEKNLKNEELRVKIILAWNYFDTRQFQLAYSTIQSVLSEAQQLKLEGEAATAENLIGKILTEEKRYQEALQHYEKGLTIRTKLKNHQGKAHILANMGDTYFAMGQYKVAASHIKKSTAIVDSIGGNSNTSWDYVRWNYLRLSTVYSEMNEYDSALKFLSYAETKSRLMPNTATRNAKDFRVRMYDEHRKILIGKGKIKEALELSLKLDYLKDSLNETSLSERIIGLQAAYELDKQAQELTLRNDEIALQKAAIRQQQIIIIAVLIVSALLIILLYISYRYYTKSRSLNYTLQERNVEIQKQSEELERANRDLHISNKNLAEKNEEVQTQAEELTEANTTLLNLNQELAEKQEELQTQSEELIESHETISKMNESLEQKVQDRTLQLQQAYKELDTFFYRSSHDFRRPLTTFMGLAEVAKVTIADKNALDLFEKVKETAVNLDRMLIKLQSISDVGAEQFMVKPVDMKAIFESSIQTYRETIEHSRIKVILKTDTIHSFYTYPAFVKIIIDNLAENAIQFSKSANSLMQLETRSKDNGVEIIVWDNGIGIEEEYIDRVFDMFFRGSQHSKGNGLGLYIVKKAVEKLQGHLSIESTFGVETKIKIWLPLQLT
jgi:signal transduction histidine kinase